ncbi:MAG TPA: oligosaccharide flippase family protein [Candidatus Saccharimonadia bacterium]|nr:oligosaccharide flippase family protein [Candidatus Saccharimonadia bacterium]
MAPRSTLVKNAFYLMLSALVVAGAGFLFWLVVTRRYDTAAVGVATTLLSVSGLLSLLGLAGFDTTFVRFLPRSQRQNDYINSGLIIVALMSAVLAAGVAVVLPRVAPQLGVVSGGWALIGFVFFTAITSLNVLTNAVFLAFKQARSIFIINALFSAVKVVAPVLAGRGDAVTIFVLAGLAQLIGLALSLVWMRRRCGWRFWPRLDLEALRLVRRFSLSVYASSILNLLPPTLLPLIIVRQMSSASAAYYYMAFTIAGVLYTIAYSSMQSVFAEGSHDEAAIRQHVARAARLIAVLLLPAALLIALISHDLLTLFGHAYAQGAATLLQLFAVGALPVAVYSALGAIFKITKNLRGVVTMNVVYAALILGLSYWLVPQFGLVAVGWSWLIGNTAACGVGGLFLVKHRYKKEFRYGTTSPTRR